MDLGQTRYPAALAVSRNNRVTQGVRWRDEGRRECLGVLVYIYRKKKIIKKTDTHFSPQFYPSPPSHDIGPLS